MGEGSVRPAAIDSIEAKSGRAPRTVASVRTDGLGQRLNTLLMAMHVADLLGVEYVFEWESTKSRAAHHAVLPARDTFNNDYRFERVLRKAPGDHVAIDGRAPDLDALRAQADGAAGWLIADDASYKALPAEMLATPPGYFRALFDRIDFRRYIVRAIAAAERVTLPEGAVSIHLRAGDIIYGGFRFTDRFNSKVIAVPIARRMIEALTAQGRTVILFGQDPLVADLFRVQSDVLIAADHSRKLQTDIEQAMFEIVLMSRCDHIYAGRASAFAHLAARLADRPVLDPTHLFTEDAQIEIIREEMIEQGGADAYPALQKAFAAGTAAHLSRRDPARALPFFETGISHDPINGFYRLKLASALYQLNRDAEGEAMLAELLTANGPDAERTRGVALDALLRPARASAFGMATDHAVFAEAAARGAPLAGHVVAHVEAAREGRRPRHWAPFPA